MTKTITLTTEQWAKILEAVNGYRDAGPVGECGGWQSLGLTEAEEALSNALDKEPNEQPD